MCWKSPLLTKRVIRPADGRSPDVEFFLKNLTPHKGQCRKNWLGAELMHCLSRLEKLVQGYFVLLF